MNKLFLVIIFLIFGIFANGQGSVYFRGGQYIFQNKVNVGSTTLAANPPDAWLTVGDSASTKAMIIPRVQSTAAVDTPRQGMIVYSISDSSFQYRTLYGWRKLSASYTGTLNLEVAGAVNGNTIIYNEVSNTWVDSTTNVFNQDGLIDGGVVTWSGTGFKYYISPSHYRINGTLYATTLDSITFGAADVTYSRYDKIILTTTGVDTLVGTPAASPSQPQTLADQIELYVKLINVGDNSGDDDGVTDLAIVYNENTQEAGGEWATTDGGAGISLASTNDASNGSKSVEYNGSLSGEYAYFDKVTSILHSPYDALTFKIKGSVFGSGGLNIFTTDRNFLRNSTVISIHNGTFGLDTTNSGWQYITIPKERMNITGDSVNKIFFQNVSSYASFFVDEIKWSQGIAQEPPAASVGSSYSASNLDGQGKGVYARTTGTEFKFKRLKNEYGITISDYTDSLGFKLDTATLASKYVRLADTVLMNGYATQYDISLLQSASTTHSKSAFWEFPAAADTIVMFTTTAAITITSIKTVCTGGSSASVTFKVLQGSDRSSGTEILSSVTTTSITTVESDTGFNDATVPANTQIWIVITAGAGNGINFNVNFTYD